MILEHLLKLAKLVYEESLKRYGVSPVGEHRWENQSKHTQNDWVGIVKVVVAGLANLEKEK